ncbi:ATP phosphoribosyltransferase regulatory subunit [Rhodobacteraceae bacterium WD3A24]|nr:ATP phosphoribosyltransferase regulatory subunit [Rhodobacteraceae bacterium WD3A24]
MASKAAARAEAARLMEAFARAGAVEVEADILQPAETLLDLYGEDIRGRAYVTADPLRGELMLRPDFTVPVVQMHMDDGAEPARYTYAGEVFRRQEHRGARASEYMQAGFELFARDDTPGADAEVFALFAQVLAPLGLRAVTGDIGILTAAVGGLSTTERRKAALMRHIWRPRRFRALLERFAGRTAPSAARREMLDRLRAGTAAELIAAAGPMIGKRGADEIAARCDALVEDAAEPPIPAAEVDLVEDVLTLRETSPDALERLRDMAVDMPALAPAADRLAARLAALEARGVDTASLDFEAAYGRTSMEYYDGFVFGFLAPGREDMPPVASGGRYGALTAVLGRGRAIPAVGGVIRPGVVADLGGLG